MAVIRSQWMVLDMDRANLSCGSCYSIACGAVWSRSSDCDPAVCYSADGRWRTSDQVPRSLIAFAGNCVGLNQRHGGWGGMRICALPSGDRGTLRYRESRMYATDTCIRAAVKAHVGASAQVRSIGAICMTNSVPPLSS